MYFVGSCVIIHIHFVIWCSQWVTAPICVGQRFEGEWGDVHDEFVCCFFDCWDFKESVSSFIEFVIWVFNVYCFIGFGVLAEKSVVSLGVGFVGAFDWVFL